MIYYGRTVGKSIAFLYPAGSPGAGPGTASSAFLAGGPPPRGLQVARGGDTIVSGVMACRARDGATAARELLGQSCEVGPNRSVPLEPLEGVPWHPYPEAGALSAHRRCQAPRCRARIPAHCTSLPPSSRRPTAALSPPSASTLSSVSSCQSLRGPARPWLRIAGRSSNRGLPWRNAGGRNKCREQAA